MRRWSLLLGDREIVLTPGNFTIGRSSSCDLVLDDLRVSRTHAVIRVGIDRATIEDAGSQNGLLVGGEWVEGSHVLSAGDIIGIGGQQLRVKEVKSRGRKRSRDRTMPQAQVAAIRAATEASARETQPTGPVPVAPPPPAEQLSRREREVLVLVARGHTSREIAERLELSVKTVEGYRARLSDKLGLRGRAELVEYALAVGLLSAPLAVEPE